MTGPAAAAAAAAARDPEAQRPPPPSGRACRPLPWALSAALVLLSGAVVALVARTLVGSRDPASLDQGPAPSPPGPTERPEAAEPQPDACARRRDSPQGISGQLVAQNAQLTNGLLSWHSSPGLEGVFLSPGLSYDKNTHELVVAEAGVYYVFLHLELQRVVAREDNNQLSVSLQLQTLGAEIEDLTLTLKLPPSSADSVAASQSGLLKLSAGQRLAVYLSSSGRHRSHWQLKQKATVLRLLRVTTEGVPPEFLLQQSR